MVLEALASVSRLNLKKKARMEEREIPFNICIKNNDPTFLINSQTLSHTHIYIPYHTHMYKQLQGGKHYLAFMSLSLKIYIIMEFF